MKATEVRYRNCALIKCRPPYDSRVWWCGFLAFFRPLSAYRSKKSRRYQQNKGKKPSGTPAHLPRSRMTHTHRALRLGSQVKVRDRTTVGFGRRNLVYQLHVDLRSQHAFSREPHITRPGSLLSALPTPMIARLSCSIIMMSSLSGRPSGAGTPCPRTRRSKSR